MTKSTVSTSELKARCSKIIEDVARRRTPVLITKRGRPLAKIVPLDGERESLFGFAKGCITVRGDIVAPLDVTWGAAER